MVHRNESVGGATNLALERAAVPGSRLEALLRLSSRGFFSFWDTVLRYFLKNIPPPPRWEASVEEEVPEGPAASAAGVAGAAGSAGAAGAGLEEEVRAASLEPRGSDKALLKGFFLAAPGPAPAPARAPSPLLRPEGLLSGCSSLRALRQFCILLHLLLEAFWNLLRVEVGEASALAWSRPPLEPVCHL